MTLRKIELEVEGFTNLELARALARTCGPGQCGRIGALEFNRFGVIPVPAWAQEQAGGY